MEGFALLCGHLVGDYIVQNDWMAESKSGKSWLQIFTGDKGLFWEFQYRPWLACFFHCFCYTLAVWAFSFWWMPWWGLLACFLIHFPIDRFSLAEKWMIYVSGQSAFATGAMAPWSIVIVDNTWHLLTLIAIEAIVHLI